MRLARRFLLALGATLLIAAPAAGADITVTTTADGLVADGQCTLREALNAARFAAPYLGCASGTAGPDTVVLGPGTHTISVAGDEDGNQSGDLDVGAAQELRILGIGAGATVIDADGLDRIFDVPATTALTLDSLTLRGGRARPGGFGGAVRNSGRLVTRRVTFTDNRSGLAAPVPPGAQGDSGAGGGAISSSGGSAELIVLDSTFDGNRSSDGGQGGPSATTPGPGGRGGDGGAILVLAGTATVHGSTFTGNLAGNGGAGGGGLAPGGQGSTGGAIAVFGGTVIIANSTFSANRAGEPGSGNGSAGGGDGGAISGGLGPNAATTVAHATFSGNLRGTGATGGNAVSGVTLAGALFTDAAPACSFSPVARLSLVTPGDTSCPGAVGGDARLGPLADNGGPTRTMLPGEGSAAIDLVPQCQIALPFGNIDQRGRFRTERAGCDMGAVEVAPPPPAPPIIPTGASVAELSNLRVLPASARPGTRRTIAFTLSDPARVVVTVRRTVTGRRLGLRCVAVRRAPRSAPRCRRTVSLSGSIARTLPTGPARIRFSGRLDGVTLPPGVYVLAVRVVGGATALRGFSVSGP